MDTTVPKYARHKWPKQVPPLDAEQRRISDDFMRRWHEVLPEKFGVVERFNHTYPLRHIPQSKTFKTLEIGAGLGAHIAFEDLSLQEYHCIELRQNMADGILAKFPQVTVVVGDCQKDIPYADNTFDRVVVVHVLEHLPDLPGCVAEMRRVLKPGGLLSVVLPCDPGLAYALARKLSAERLFKKWYGLPYGWLIRREHINGPGEILSLLTEQFEPIDTAYFPLTVPVVAANLCIGITLTR